MRREQNEELMHFDLKFLEQKKHVKENSIS